MSVICCWQPLLTEHSVHTLKAIAEHYNKDPIFIVTRESDRERSSQGWTTTELESHIILSPGIFGRIRAVKILFRKKECIHIFGSPLENKLDIIVYVFVRLLRLNTVIMSEPINDSRYSYFEQERLVKIQAKKLIRSLYQLLITKILGNRAVLLAISKKSGIQYRSYGWNKALIYPWGYYVPKLPIEQGKCKRHPLKLLFVGNLIPRKGLETLLKGLAGLRGNSEFVLDVYGPGNIENYSSYSNSFNYRGIIPFGKAQEVMRMYDLTIVPSLFDGWGVVVNESILAGVPVLVSNDVGASDLVRQYNCGLVINGKDVTAYTKTIERILLHPNLLTNWQLCCVQAGQKITPDYKAKHLVKKLKLLWKND